MGLGSISNTIFAPATKLFSFGGGGDKDARRQEDSARQRQEIADILDQYLAQLVPGSEEYNQLITLGNELLSRSEEGPYSLDILGGQSLDQQPAASAIGAKLVKQQQDRIAGGGAATPLEARTNKAYEGVKQIAQPSSFEQDLLDALSGDEINTPIGQVFSRQVSRAASPTIDDDVFKNALKLVEDRVNQEYAARGGLGSGLRLEGLGRAGVDAAIAEAQRQDSLRQEAYANSVGIYDAGENLRNRAIGVEGDLLNIQLGRESKLTSLLDKNSQTSVSNTRSLLDDRTAQATANRLDVQDEEAALRAALGQAVGTGLGYVVGGPVGGYIGGQAGGTIAGGGRAGPSNASALLEMERSAPASQSGGVAKSLSIHPNSGAGDLTEEELDALLRIIR